MTPRDGQLSRTFAVVICAVVSRDNSTACSFQTAAEPCWPARRCALSPGGQTLLLVCFGTASVQRAGQGRGAGV